VLQSFVTSALSRKTATCHERLQHASLLATLQQQVEMHVAVVRDKCLVPKDCNLSRKTATCISTCHVATTRERHSVEAGCADECTLQQLVEVRVAVVRDKCLVSDTV